MEKFRNIFRVDAARLSLCDYSSHGLYFVTICTKNKINYFGDFPRVETDNNPSQNNPSPKNKTNNRCETDYYPSLRETVIGKKAREFWLEIPNHFPFVELMEFVIMPDHLHGVLFFNKPDFNIDDWCPNKFGSQSQNLASVIRAYKGSVKRFANQNGIEFNWQNSYYDHVIKSEEDLENIRQYIHDNPIKWISRRDG